MFMLPLQEKRDYFSTSERSMNYSQKLWHVNDNELHKPGERFIGDSSPYLDTVIERSIAGPLESAPIPKGLLIYIQDAVKMFGVVPSKYSSIEEVLYRVMRWLDFEEFYFLIFGSAVQLNSNQLKFTYRFKKDGAVLPPNNLECFSVTRSYDFPQYKACCEFLNHPSVVAALSGQTVMHHSKKEPITRRDVAEKMSEILYGDYGAIMAEVEQWLFTYYLSLESSRVMTDEEILSLDSERQLDSIFWSVVTLSALMWFKSPYAIRFLSEYHQIYMKLLRWDEKTGKMAVIAASGGEVIVDGWDIYTRENLIVEENNPPGTCECCKLTLHCTKYINAQALFHGECSCGNSVPIEDTDFSGHDWKGGCSSYLNAHPPFNAFVCQRDIYAAVNHRRPEETKCPRAICPAIECPHHMGNRALAHELTKRRMHQLTHHRIQ